MYIVYNQPGQAVDEEEGDGRRLTRPRSRTWQAGEDISRGWIGDLNPLFEAREPHATGIC